MDKLHGEEEIAKLREEVVSGINYKYVTRECNKIEYIGTI